MYKRRLPRLCRLLILELTTCVLALILEKRRERRKKGGKEKNERNDRSIWETSIREISRAKCQTSPRRLKGIEDVERGMGSYLRVQVWVRMTGCETCNLRERRKGWQVFFDVT
jgi:hypothetical protein